MNKSAGDWNWSESDPQEFWDAYYDRIRRRRLAEVDLMWDEIESSGANEETAFTMDFLHFGNNRVDVDALASQLSENYTVEIEPMDKADYWQLTGTTRPEGICLTKDMLGTWAEFMADVSRSYGCVFSEWMLEAPSLSRSFRSAHLDLE